MFNECNAILKGNELCFIVNLLPAIINSNVFLVKAYNKQVIRVSLSSFLPPCLLLFLQ